MTATGSSAAPLHVRFWTALRNFPGFLERGAANPPDTNGMAAAALIAPGIGALVMMLSHHFSEVSEATEKFVWSMGYWMPGSKTGDPIYGEIGSYSGKATFLLIGWLVSWVVLHFLLRDRNVKPGVIFGSMMLLFVAATVMAWHPIFPYLPLQ
jgi:hypothetical protein